VETDPHHHTPRQVQQKALINMLVVALEQVKPKHLAAHCLMWKPGKTLGDSLRDVKAHALADTMADTLLEAKALTVSIDRTRCNCSSNAQHIG